jgi:hypothetical protein
MAHMSTTTSTWPSYSQTDFNDWQEIDNAGTFRRVCVHEDELAWENDDLEDVEYCTMTVEVKRGTLPTGWGALCGIGVQRSANWPEVCEWMDTHLAELTEEAIDHMIRQSLLGDRA